MISKNEILDKLTFSAISFAGIVIFVNQKYVNFPAFLIFIASRYLGKSIEISTKEETAGGTTPYNPLKIPAKVYNFTPAKKNPDAGGSTPYNPLKIPAKKITPIH